MARNDGIDRTSARNVDVPDKDIGNTQKHNEREKDSYRNPDIVPERTPLNIHFKAPTAFPYPARRVASLHRAATLWRQR